MRLRAVLKQVEVMLFGESGNLVHLGRLSVQMHGNNGLAAWRIGILKPCATKIVSRPIRLNQNDMRTSIAHGQRCRNERIGRNDDLIARAACQTDALPCIIPPRKLPFKSRAFFPANKPVVVINPCECLNHFFPDLMMDWGDSRKRNLHINHFPPNHLHASLSKAA